MWYFKTKAFQKYLYDKLPNNLKVALASNFYLCIFAIFYQNISKDAARLLI